ncbi:DUF6478 family protein [Rhodovulum adriaticum]|uniref:Uncharacterized protein n=1 Tax=Rhodovulum adriaticum TaxID=35804 RepID=A0A4R2P0L5_RHOAD|nr:DUF6478 family protein [Rhodovulum adriaticum]MBK1634973.1 hypothetical protein [Rhodovulum adriaticum]TCP27444.1 hypothetical protein EV656_101350 [Rhodovulum adriaticum]
MVAKTLGFLDRFLFRRSLSAWTRAGERVAVAELDDLRPVRNRAWQLRRRLDQVIHVSEERLTLPRIGHSAIRKPLGTDWAYRPELFRGPVFPAAAAALPTRSEFGAEASIHHDCQRSELTFRQIRNTRAADIAPYGVRLDVFRFDGSFLSMVVDLPAAACEGLRRNHLMRLETIVETEYPLEIFARLNVKHGPNIEQVVRELPLGAAEIAVDFDLAYTELNEKRVEKAWLDLIFEGPEMNQIILRDVTLTRRPRAEL